MSERLTIRLFNAQQGHQAIQSIWAHAKALLLAGHRPVLELGPEGQSRDQQEKYHAMIGEVAAQAKHLGASWDAEDWKRLLLDRFARETGRAVGKVIPNLSGDGVVEVGILSRRFSKRTANEFIEWLLAWGAENGIEYSDPQWMVDAETGEIT